MIVRVIAVEPQSVPVVRQLFATTVCCCRNGTATASSSDDLDAAMVDCGYHLLSVGVWDSPIVSAGTSFAHTIFMVYKCAILD